MLRNVKILNSYCLYTTSNFLGPQIVATGNKIQICCHTTDTKDKNKNYNFYLFNNTRLCKSNFGGSTNSYTYFDRNNVNLINRLCCKYIDTNICLYSTTSNTDKTNLNLKSNVTSNANEPKIIDRCKEKIDPYLKLMRVERPIGTWLLFWPGAWSILLASSPSVCSLSTTAQTLALFLTGAFVMRGAGCTINDMWDKNIDAKVERTKDRPLVSGRLSQKQALIFLAGQLSVGLSILLQLNWYSVVLGSLSMVLVVIYPLAKRVTYYPQLALGLCFNWGALLGWSALHGSVSPSCIALYVAGVSWTLFYDTIYAHQDKRDDAIIGIKSTALKFGDSTKSYLAAFVTSFVSSLSVVGVLCDLEWPYYLFVGGVTAHTAQQIATLDMDNPKDCADKFVSNHRVGLLIFLGILLGKWKTWTEYFNKPGAIDNFKKLERVNTL